MEKYKIVVPLKILKAGSHNLIFVYRAVWERKESKNSEKVSFAGSRQSKKVHRPG